MDWFRWHHGTVNDPKLKLIAQKAGQPLTTVIAVWAAMEERASENVPRGTLEGWDPEAVAAGLEIDTSAVLAIYDAMQGRTLERYELRAWRKRQPRREDDSTDRVRAFRERSKPTEPVDETQSNATKRNVTLEQSRVDKKEQIKKKPSVSKKASWKFCPDDFQPGEKHAALAARLGVDMLAQLAAFKDHEFKVPKTDADRAFSTWLRNAPTFARAPARPQFGNEVQRDVGRSHDAIARQTNRESREREEAEERAERETREAWEWYEELTPAAKSEIQREVQGRTSNLGRASPELLRALTLGVVNERRRKTA